MTRISLILRLSRCKLPKSKIEKWCTTCSDTWWSDEVGDSQTAVCPYSRRRAPREDASSPNVQRLGCSRDLRLGRWALPASRGHRLSACKLENLKLKSKKIFIKLQPILNKRSKVKRKLSNSESFSPSSKWTKILFGHFHQVDADG